MVKRIRLGTFNVNNLFDRFDDPYQKSDDPWRRKFASKRKPLKELFHLGERIKESEMDVLAVQEVESIGMLKEFVSGHLGEEYKQNGVFSIESNDLRGIDLGIVSKFPLGRVTNHRFRRENGTRVFSRGCLEVEILDKDYSKVLFTLFIVHLKSQYSEYVVDTPEWKEDQKDSDAKRRRQLEHVIEIVKESQSKEGSRYVILGDFNDTPDSPPVKWFLEKNGLGLVDALKTIDPEYKGGSVPVDEKRKRDTHKWEKAPDKGHKETTYSQLDFILLSRTLKGAFTKKAVVEQSGHTAGSDHYLCWVQLDIDKIQ